MKRANLLACAAIAAALGAAACAGSGNNNAASMTPAEENAANAAAAAAANPAPSATTSGYSDEQLRAFVAVSAEVGALTQGTTPEAQADYARQAGEILVRHNLDATTYNGIVDAARTDSALALRIGELRIENVTDDTLRHFLAAAQEINPIASGVTAEATAEQRAQASTQIAAILDRHDLDSATYNAIAARAQSDPAFASRIMALRGATTTPQ